jgi:hypothetical protein
MLTTESLLVVLLLLPGFLAARVFSLVAAQRRKTPFESLGEVVLFELLVLCAYGLSGELLDGPALVWPVQDGADVRTVEVLRANAPALASLLALAVVAGVLVGWLHNVDQPLGLLRRLRMTRQSSHSTVWQTAFYGHRGWVVVHLASGDRIVGWPEQFSDTPEEGALFLSKAAFVGEDGEPNEIHGPGILLTREDRIRMVEFVDEK